jgi:hypothetical protein
MEAATAAMGGVRVALRVAVAARGVTQVLVAMVDRAAPVVVLLGQAVVAVAVLLKAVDITLAVVAEWVFLVKAPMALAE